MNLASGAGFAKRAIQWGPVGLWMIVIFVLSSQPGGPTEPPLPDYVLHFTAYGILGALTYRAAGGSRRACLVASATGAVYGVSDELHQAFVPGRDPSVTDWIADLAGSSAIPLLLHLCRRYMDRRRIVLTAASAAIMASVPLVAFARQAFPSASNALISSLILVAPAGSIYVLRRAGLTLRLLGLLLFAAASVQLSMHLLHLTLQEMLHLYEYGALGYLSLALAPDPARVSLLGGISISGLVALADEGLQWLWPGRAGEIKDVGEDVFFAACGALLFSFVLRPERRLGWSRRSEAGAALLVAGAAVFFWQVHTGVPVSVEQVSFLTTGCCEYWPPREVIKKEAFSHIRHRNERYHAGDYRAAAAENLILERRYSEFMDGHRYSPEQREKLPPPPAGYRSPVPEQLYLERK